VWRFESPGRTRTVDSHANRLRHKLCDGGDDKLVLTIWGVGYRLMDRASSS
jgi:DNA-binding response OmpR family regulator